MQVFVIATAADWAAARAAGAYTTSTRGRTLEEEGFLHASRREQVQGVFERYYADVTEPLVLLTVDTDRLEAAGVEWREDPVRDDTYPHVYGALPPSAVVRVVPLTRAGLAASFTQVFVREVLAMAVLVVGAMLLSALGVAVGRAVGGAWGPFVGGVVGLGVGVVVASAVTRRRGRR